VKRELVREMENSYQISERRACSNMTYARSVIRYRRMYGKNLNRHLYISPDGKYIFYNSISDTGKNSDIFWVDAKIIEGLKPKELR
jgi:hypothetical protein